MVGSGVLDMVLVGAELELPWKYEKQVVWKVVR